jgi:hypothetical protein
MKMIFFFLFLILISTECIGQISEVRGLNLRGPYLGQKVPSMTAEIFAPGIISTGLYTRDITISKDGKEIYFSISDASVTAIFITKQVNGYWTEPVIAPFSGKGFFDFEPHISPDGSRFYFLSNRPPEGKEARPGWAYQKIWMMRRLENGWSEPEMVPEPVSSADNEFFPSSTNEGALYFTRSNKAGKAMIYKSVWLNDTFEKPEILNIPVPGNGILFNAFVSPDEDYLITCALNMDSTNTDQDYFISFKNSTGEWGKLIKFGPELNSPGDNANSAYVSPDGKFLFFSSSRKNPDLPKIRSGSSVRELIRTKSVPGYGTSAIYWIDARIIERLKPAN